MKSTKTWESDCYSASLSSYDLFKKYIYIYILAKQLASFMLNKIEGKVLPKALTAKTPIKYAKYKTSWKFFIFLNCKTCISGSIEQSKQVLTTNMPTLKLNCSFRINLDGYI